MKTLMMYLGLFVLAMGCTTYRITHSWRAASCLKKYYSKILVVGPIQDNDRNLTGKMEDHLKGDLSAGGYSTISYLAAYGPKSFERMT